MFAKPMPAISWLPSTVSPRRAAKVRESTALSVKATSAMPAAGSASAATSAHSSPPSAGAGRPCGSAPTTGRSSARPKIAVIAMVSTTTTSTPGTGERSHLSAKMTTSEPTPNAAASGCTSPILMPAKLATISCQSESASIEKPRSFGICEMITMSAIALR